MTIDSIIYKTITVQKTCEITVRVAYDQYDPYPSMEWFEDRAAEIADKSKHCDWQCSNYEYFHGY